MKSCLTRKEQTPDFYDVKILRAAEFSPEKAMQALQLIRVRELQKGMASTENPLQFLSSCVNFQESQMMSALGALLGFLKKTTFKLEDGPLQMHSIRPFSLTSSLQIDPISLRALSIFASDAHPRQDLSASFVQPEKRALNCSVLFGPI